MPQEPTIPDLAARVRRLAEFLASEHVLSVRIERAGDEIELRRRPQAVSASRVAPGCPDCRRILEPSLEAIKAGYVGIFRLGRPAPVEGELLDGDRELGYIEQLGIRNVIHSLGAGRIVTIASARRRGGRIWAAAFPGRSRLKEERTIFRKVLIANRGEIALRINRACQELGVLTVAVFSEADRESLHVRQADEAFCVGPGPVGLSYLNIPNIISTALVTGCDAIHPGYGFLAENSRFAEICADHGLTFIGPRPDVIAAMGDKATAKRVMQEAGVATTPGTDILAGVEAARRAAERIGYPVLLKATAGGGGKGMRSVERPEDLERAYAGATAEAEASFKDGRVYMEKLIIGPRHIEVQVLADEFGNVVHLGERDCSMQKPSHQKLIEEAPAAHLSRTCARRLPKWRCARASTSATRMRGRWSFWFPAKTCTSWK